ncbi:glycosyltransferase [Frigoribacterium sp. PhB160]|uniref:glycosyltransferase n=1 Tax=Frigoribacterium sp. PhB160 TaxID=2485192 RepID=UPI0013150D04|nr:glycosyltransferase [Frigoribacterium sp. PhB160]
MDLFEEGLPPAVHTLRFSYRAALLGRYDVVHVQWPEYIFRGSTGPKAAVKAIIGLTFLARLRLLGVPVVETVHNLRSHEPAGRLERMQVRLLEKLTVVKVYLNESPENDMAAGVVVLHGAYPVSDVGLERTSRGSSKILTFGQVRPYKGVEDLITAVGPLADVELVIAGLPIDLSYARRVRELAHAVGQHVTLRLEHLDDKALEATIRAADLVVLPYKRMYNSGAALLALGSARPVLLPRSGSTTALAEEVGHEWVTLFDPPIAASDVRVARERVEGLAAAALPDLSRRNRQVVGRLHEKIYATLLAEKHNGGTSRAGWRSGVLRRLAGDDEFRRHSRFNADGGGGTASD